MNFSSIYHCLKYSSMISESFSVGVLLICMERTTNFIKGQQRLVEENNLFCT